MANYCAQCGKVLGGGARFCSVCGARVAGAPWAWAATVPAGARLVRPRQGRMVAGVCQGLATAYRWDVSWVRVIAVLAAVFSSGAGGIAYIVFWIVMPEEPFLLPQTASAYAPPPAGGAAAVPPDWSAGGGTQAGS